MSKRKLPVGVKCRRVNITASPADVAYWKRRAADAKVRGEVNASVSGEIRKTASEARRLRHDLASPRTTLALVADGLRRGEFAAADAANVLEQINADIGAIVDPPAAKVECPP